MIMNLYRNIDRSKIQFDFVVHTNNKCDYDDEINALGGVIYSIPRYTGKNHFQYKKSWYNLLKQHPEYKIIHGHVRSTAAIYLNIANEFGLMTVAHSHSTSSGEGLSAFIKNALQYRIRFTADYLFACSKTAGEWLFGEKATKNENFLILNNAIDAKKYIYNEQVRKMKRNELRMDNSFIIGHIGRFSTPKNHDFLIDVFNEVYKKNKNAKLILVGDGNLRDYIMKKVNRLGLCEVIFFTGLRTDISELLQAMDIVVFPSLYEGLPVTIIEAQASGLPCLVSNRITKEVKITKLVEFLSLEDDAELWAKKTIEISEGFERENMYNEIVLGEYDIKSVSKKYEELFAENKKVLFT
ncbi:glycosyl transferase family 1 [Sporosarcina sp. P21c]|nr:glycosyl transferase family 1 [Sporosarcina sp. P21c]